MIILYLNKGEMTRHKAAEAVYNNTETRDILWLTKLQGGLWMVVKGKWDFESKLNGFDLNETNDRKECMFHTN